jgi:hypothetical protein
MPPAAVWRHREIGIAPPGHVGDELRDLAEALRCDAEMRGFPALRECQDQPAARAHRGGAKQIVGVGLQHGVASFETAAPQPPQDEGKLLAGINKTPSS